MRTSILCLLALLLAPAALAQDAADSDSTDYLRYRDRARDLQVITVRLDGAHYIFDRRGGDESEAVLWTNGSALVVHGIQAGHVMVAVEPDEGTVGAVTPAAVFLSPAQQAQQIEPDGSSFRDLGYEDVGRFTVHILRCADEEDRSDRPMADRNACQNWVRVRPLSGGDDLRLIFVSGPELGGNDNRPVDD